MKNLAAKLRWILVIILLLTAAITATLGHLLLRFGIISPAERSAITFPAGYLAFFLIILIWRNTVASRIIQPYEDSLHTLTHPPEKDPKKQHQEVRKPKWYDGLFPTDLGEITIILILVVAVIWVTVWVLGEAPAIMAESILDLGLSASIAGALSKRRGSPWYQGLFKKTRAAFLVFYVASILLLLFSEKTCTGRPTLGKIIHECWMQKY
jgi:hypothetical protein